MIQKKRQKETVFKHMKSMEQILSRQTRRQRNKDNQMKRIIEMVRETSPIQSQPEDPEYYPQRLKRKPNTKKILLKATNQMEKIGELNKRKKNVPQHHSEMFRNMLNNDIYKGLTVAEVIVMKEQTEELSEEDFMAILTCPSPVWWEEHNDFEEDPIAVTEKMEVDKKETTDNMETSTEASEKSTEVIDKVEPVKDKEGAETELLMPELEEANFEGKFLEKRLVLENVLSNIKSNKSSPNKKTNETLRLKSILKPISEPTVRDEAGVVSEEKTDVNNVASDEKVQESSVETPCCSKSLKENAFLCENKNNDETKEQVDTKTIFMTENLGLSKKVLTEKSNSETQKEKLPDNSLIIERYVKILKNRMKRTKVADENLIQNYAGSNNKLCLSGS